MSNSLSLQRSRHLLWPILVGALLLILDPGTLIQLVVYGLFRLGVPRLKPISFLLLPALAFALMFGPVGLIIDNAFGTPYTYTAIGITAGILFGLFVGYDVRHEQTN